MNINRLAIMAREIVRIANNEDYPALSDTSFEPNVKIVFCTPLMQEKDYRQIFKSAKGIILVGYGGGNVNIDVDSGFSPLKPIQEAVEEGKFIALASHAEKGVVDPLYENSFILIKEKLCVPIFDFSLSRAQIKLSYLLGHQEAIQKVAARTNNGSEIYRKLLIASFLSGARFANEQTKREIEQKFEVRVPKEDVFINRQFYEALEEVMDFQKKKGKSIIIINTSEELVSKEIPREKYVLILKPDRTTGINKWGEEIDATKNIVSILKRNFEWNFYILEMSALDINKLQNLNKFQEVLLKSHLLIGAGGRYKSFENISQDEFKTNKNEIIKIYKELLKFRGESSFSTPGIFIGLSSLVLVEALFDLLNEVINRDFSNEEWLELKNKIQEKMNSIVGHQKKFFVSKKSSSKRYITTLSPYSPSKNIDQSLLLAQFNIDFQHSGIIEELICIDRMDVFILDEYEINEVALLFLNWALQEIWSFRKKMPYSEEIKDLFRLPIGLEITSSIYSEAQVRKIASFNLYYHDYRQDYIYKDFCFHFHPELISTSVMRTIYPEEEFLTDFRNDGVKIIIASIIGAFQKEKINL